jgi:23S rRNA pseudouridine2605 synthase
MSAYGARAMRLAKFLAHAGVASRRAAEDLVRAGRVTVAGEVVLDPARTVQEGATDVAVDGRRVGAQAPVVIALHKPAGVVSTARDTHGRQTVVDLVADAGVRLYPVGRLDVDTTGLLLLTNDGELANLLTHPRHEVPKTYRAEVHGGRVSAEALRALRDGLELDDGPTLPAEVSQPQPGLLELTLREGRKRQVKRMCEAVGHRVRRLSRIRFGPLELGDLAPGEHRRLDAEEVDALRRAAKA